jgi:hypothetical protein
MKWILLMISTLLLSGCPGTRDCIPSTEKADVILQKNEVCVRVQPHDDEKLEAISIYRLSQSEERTTRFFSPMMSVNATTCLPNNEFVYEDNVAYHYSAKLTSAKKQSAQEWSFSREFEVEFRVKKSDGKMQIETLAPQR